MKKILFFCLSLFLTALTARSQDASKLERIKAAKLRALTQSAKSTADLKKIPQFQSADPLQKSVMISMTKKSAQTRSQQGATNLSITSPDGKTTKRIVKVASLDGIQQRDLSGEQKQETPNPDGSKVVCTTKKVRMEAGYSDNNLLSPMEEVMWVGNILDGNSVLNGGYGSLMTLTAADRNAYPVSIDLNSTGSQPLNAMVGANGRFSRGDFNNAVNAIKNQGITLPQSGESGFSYSEVYSSNQVYANLSASLSVVPANLTSTLNITGGSNSTKTSYLVQFYEIWYTATLDMNTWELVKDLSKVSDEALVISSIKYGRMGTFIFETTTDIDSLQAYLDLAFSVNPNVAVQTVNSAGFRNVHRNTSIKSYASGANGALTSLENFMNFVKAGPWTASSPAQPIGYTLRFVKDGQIANVNTITEFNLRSCDIIPPPGRTLLTLHVGDILPTRDIEAWGEDLCGRIDFILRYKDAAGKTVEEKKTVWNVGCSPRTWMAGIDDKNPLSIGKKVSFEVDAEKARTASVTVVLDIRDGLEGKGQWGMNEWNLTSEINRKRGFVQYKIFNETYTLQELAPQAPVTLDSHSVTLQEEGGTPRVKSSFYITKQEIK